MARLSEHGIRLSSMSPSFLNSNSTSHTWPFSAVAELIDNASDPGVCAKQFWIDVVHETDHLCLSFIDNGSGMTPNKLHKMLSFGFTEKGSGKASQQAIGVYGNGFKSGSMRLGRDALIFTKNGGCQTVGMLSQTYLESIKAQAVIVPIVPFNQQTKLLVVTEDSQASLTAVLDHSIVKSLEQIHSHFDSIPSKKGTKILIWNIRRSESHVRVTLKVETCILYLKPRTQIILRGKKIQAKLVAKRLIHIEHDVYKPHFSKDKVKVTFGLSPKNKDHYGIMMYHKNRLIKAFEKVGCQLKTSGLRAGIGVIGVIECNFLKPAHNKQDFEYTKEYRLTLGALGLKLNDYWKEVTEKKAREREFQALDKNEKEVQEDVDEGPMWLQCEECLKWRSIPDGFYRIAPESWTCSQNPNSRYRSCSSPEETEEHEELLTASYQKSHKKLEYSRGTKRKSLEVSEVEEQVSKHQIVLRSSSKPSKVENADELTDLNDTFANDDAESQSDTGTREEAAGRDTVTKKKNEIAKGASPEENEISDKRLQDEESDKTENADMETEEEEHLETLRMSDSILYVVKKKRYLWKLHQSDSAVTDKELHSGKQSDIVKTLSPEKNKKDASSRVENSDTNPPQTHTGNTWQHSLPSTQQTVIVPPLSRTEGQQSRVLPTEGANREAKMQRLVGLEKEAEKLRSLLGLEITKTTRGTMTNDDSDEKSPTQTLEKPSGRKEVGCQTDMAECSTSSSGLIQAAELHGLKAVSESNNQPELSRARKEKTDSQTRTRLSDTEAHEDNRSVQENLHDIRNNVVVLLTALLPQLDLAGISLETNDVDNILQQIIEVNSLKL
ncbi:MORC family CW-type zinc finger protein 3 [Neolamprologus brichardi]|uniref:MORC family CW-type zinc finger protein 3 n=1 Tax=Neolamprologus brichardi TaxID=32507 RepID=UPI001643CA56|nr:MORC family CW-type zinc finger protein 3 [Neolamprologus brichardi]